MDQNGLNKNVATPSTRRSARVQTRKKGSNSKSRSKTKSPLAIPLPSKARRTRKITAKPKSKNSKSSSLSEIVRTAETPNMSDIDTNARPWLQGEYTERMFNMLSSSPITAQERPELLVLVGPPASGKSTVKKQLEFTNAVNIDVDEFQIQTTKDFGNPSTFKVIKDYPIFIQIMSKKAVMNRYNMILDTTGKMKSQIKYVIHLAKRNGYKITMAFVYSTESKCEERVMIRKDADIRRRPIPLHVIKKTYQEFVKNKIVNFYLVNNHQRELMGEVDNLYLFDNSGDTPTARIVLEKHGNETIVHNPFPNFYSINIINEPPYFIKV